MLSLMVVAFTRLRECGPNMAVKGVLGGSRGTVTVMALRPFGILRMYRLYTR